MMHEVVNVISLNTYNYFLVLIHLNNKFTIICLIKDNLKHVSQKWEMVSSFHFENRLKGEVSSSLG